MPEHTCTGLRDKLGCDGCLADAIIFWTLVVVILAMWYAGNVPMQPNF